MRCIRFHRACRYVPCVAVLLAIGAAPHRAAGQQPYPPPQNYPVYPQPSPPQPYPYPTSPPPVGAGGQQSPLATYRVPTITIAAPTEGTTLPEDKPVAVLRFVSAEPLDPIDALSFSIAVDGHDKTALFQLSQGEAWGPLAARDESLSPGQHEIIARICTAHGACGTTKSNVTIVSASSSLPATKSVAKVREKKNKMLDALLQAARALLK